MIRGFETQKKKKERDSIFTVPITSPWSEVVEKSPKNVTVNFSKFFAIQHLSDVEFIFQNGTTTRYLYFDKMFSGEWALKTKIQIEVEEFVTFQAILYHLYHDELDPLFPPKKFADLYNKSIKFQVQELTKQLSNSMIKHIDIDNWDSFFMLGWKYEDYELKEAAIRFAISEWEQVIDAANPRKNL
ncbi:hypothetical protein G9A89_004398 [Geosiphon pyriformis]|nr:hypothetical protein G9A89_004398 [Geosiphon pyriformis]